MSNLAKIKAHKEDNSTLAGTSPDTPALLSPTLLDVYKADLEAEQDRSRDYERHFRNVKKQIACSVAARDTPLEQQHAGRAATYLQLGAVAKAQHQLSSQLAISQGELQHEYMLHNDAQEQISQAKGRTAMLTTKVKKLHM